DRARSGAAFRPYKLWSRLEPPLCARSSLCSVSTQCWRSSPCTDDSLQLELGPGSGGILECTLEGERGRPFHKFTVSGVWSENVSPHSWGTPGSCGPASGPAPPKGPQRAQHRLLSIETLPFKVSNN
ncbi:hypothetical protein DNTS_008986, partial [Danionella cerebrum]